MGKDKKLSPMIRLLRLVRQRYTDASPKRRAEITTAIVQLKRDGKLDDYLSGPLTMAQAVELFEYYWFIEYAESLFASQLFDALLDALESLSGLEDQFDDIRHEARYARIVGKLDDYLCGRTSLDEARKLVLISWQDRQPALPRSGAAPQSQRKLQEVVLLPQDAAVQAGRATIRKYFPVRVKRS